MTSITPGAFSGRPPRYFYIRSQMNGCVLDVEGGDEGSGSDVITYDHNEQDNQQWYQDRRGFIRSKINDLIWDTSGMATCC